MNSKRPSYGLPLKCPACSQDNYYGMLKTPEIKSVPCPNCSTRLEPCKPKRKP